MRARKPPDSIPQGSRSSIHPARLYVRRPLLPISGKLRLPPESAGRSTSLRPTPQTTGRPDTGYACAEEPAFHPPAPSSQKGNNTLRKTGRVGGGTTVRLRARRRLGAALELNGLHVRARALAITVLVDRVASPGPGSAPLLLARGGGDPSRIGLDCVAGGGNVQTGVSVMGLPPPSARPRHTPLHVPQLLRPVRRRTL